MDTTEGPLAGIRVVELDVVIAGLATAAILAVWGADVVKLEPPDGDPQRGHLSYSAFRLDNRTKRSSCLDLKAANGRRVARELAGNSGVFVSNLRPSALARLGLDVVSHSADGLVITEDFAEGLAAFAAERRPLRRNR